MISELHEKIVLDVCLNWDATPTKMATTLRSSEYRDGKRQYFPDATTDDTDFEVEMLNKKKHIKVKESKWDSNRKKVLIISPSEDLFNLFDEVYAYRNGEFIKLR